MRSAAGSGGTWYRHARTTHEGRIRAGGVEADVTLQEAGNNTPDLTDAIQTEYHRIYDHHGPDITRGALSRRAQNATYRLLPR